jgi:hypothetical protein
MGFPLKQSLFNVIYQSHKTSAPAGIEGIYSQVANNIKTVMKLGQTGGWRRSYLWARTLTYLIQVSIAHLTKYVNA